MTEDTLATPALSRTGEEGTHDLGESGPASQLVAMYAADERACAARDRLVADGVSAEDIHLVDARAVCAARSLDEGARDEGLWGAVRRLFAPGEADAHGYAEGVRRGCVMLLVRTRPERHGRVLEALEGTDPLDVDAHLAEWGAFATSDEAGASWTGPFGAIGSSGAEATPDNVSGPAGGLAAAGAVTLGAGAAGEVIPVIEERVRVGKRAVERGTVRVRSYVVEYPVQARVTLREERLRVDRHPVDRPAGAADGAAFRECLIEVSATGEEAVVSKEVRVVEEIKIRREATERVEVVNDTVRRTEVVVEGDDPEGDGPGPDEAGRWNPPER